MRKVQSSRNRVKKVGEVCSGRSSLLIAFNAVAKQDASTLRSDRDEGFNVSSVREMSPLPSPWTVVSAAPSECRRASQFLAPHEP